MDSTGYNGLATLNFFLLSVAVRRHPARRAGCQRDDGPRGLSLVCSNSSQDAGNVLTVSFTLENSIVPITQLRLSWLTNLFKMRRGTERRSKQIGSPTAGIRNDSACIDPRSQGMNRMGETRLLFIGLLLGSLICFAELSAQAQPDSASSGDSPSSAPAEPVAAETPPGDSPADVPSDASPSPSPSDRLPDEVVLIEGSPTESAATNSATPDGESKTAQTVVIDSHMKRLRRDARQAARRLETFLQYGDSDNTQRWKAFLHWKAIQRQVQPGVQPDPEILAKPLASLYSGEPGLELPRFVELRNALMGFRRLALYRTDPRARQAFDEQLQKVAQQLSADGSRRDYAILANQLEILRQLRFDPQLVRAVAGRYRHPNLYLSASSSMVSRAVKTPVDRVEPVNQMILGTHVSGTAHLQGQLTATLLPCQDHALVQLHLTGRSSASTVGRQSPVTVYGGGITNVHAQKTIFIDQAGIRSDPATANCSTQSYIRSIRADNQFGKRLVEKVAWKKALKQRHRAEQISSRRAEWRIARSLDQQTRQRVAESNTRLRKRLRRPLEGRNLFPRRLNFATTRDRLSVTGTQANEQQLAASDRPPTCPPHGVVMQVHETMVLNTAINLVAGRHLTDVRAVELMEEVTGKVPEEFKLRQDEEPWSITFDIDQPVRVTFDDNQVIITIRGRRFTRGDQVVRQTTDIGAVYDIEIHDGRGKLIRNGDVQVTYPGSEGRLSLAELRNKTFLTSKFEGLFKPELGGNGVQLPEDMEDLRKIENLRLEYALSHNGWLTLGWN